MADLLKESYAYHRQKGLSVLRYNLSGGTDLCKSIIIYEDSIPNSK